MNAYACKHPSLEGSMQHLQFCCKVPHSSFNVGLQDISLDTSE